MYFMIFSKSHSFKLLNLFTFQINLIMLANKMHFMVNHYDVTSASVTLNKNIIELILVFLNTADKHFPSMEFLRVKHVGAGVILLAVTFSLSKVVYVEF